MDEWQYFLKREYGHPMTFIHVSNASIDVSTGAVHSTETSYTVNSAIYLPVAIAREIKTAARSGSYPYGDFFDLASSLVLVDKKDLPVDFQLNNNDKIIFTDTNQQFQVTNVVDLHHREIHCVQLAVEELQRAERAVI